MYLNKTAVKKMNLLGKKDIPFIFIIDFEEKKPIIVDLENALKENIFFDFNGFKNYIISQEQKSAFQKKSIKFQKFPVKYSRYLQSFKKALKEIKFGNSYLINLTFQTPIITNFTFKNIFFQSRTKYKLLFKNKFVVFSPETFFQIKNNIISTFPMKGTINANIKNAEEVLIKDKKELAEHNTVVDLLRNDLSIVAEKVRVEKFRFVDKIKTNSGDLLQISSKISGNLNKNWKGKLGDIFNTLLPAGSICGAPKKKTVEIIKSTENYSRGYYTGICGYFDGKTVDSCVMIRFIEKDNNGEMFFKSGGGITVFSDPKKEYKELIDKIYVPVV
ncbi:aminodeoxychorismate synthase component I [Candidatus Peregrinibacteria bacterium]|nr:aminodeoxychorismate synthase component I [Candidatus Peregrinibacteria bacterium]